MRTLLLATLFIAAATVHARDDLLTFPIDAALSTEQAKSKLDPNISLYFGDQKHGKAQKTYGNFLTNKKTNAVGKSDEQACNWAFLSAVMELQERAVKEGGNAVVNIHSYYKKHDLSSATQFECGAGSMMSGVALKGDVVTIAK